MSEKNALTAEGRRDKREEELVLTFVVGREQFALPLLNVREIIGYVPPIPIPHSPDYLKGIINLRGRIIPVMDLRTKFQMPAAAITQQTCIIVAESSRGGKTELAGLLVDRVLEVLEINSNDIEPPAEMLTDASFLQGLIRSDSCVRLLLDIDQTLCDAPALLTGADQAMAAS
jgi:purine-binding chemotaxis protein CheW